MWGRDFIIVLVAVSVGVFLRLRYSSPKENLSEALLPSQLKKFHSAAVAGDNTVCSRIGTAMMKKGGTAIDAAIANMICIGAVDPHYSGIGGGHVSLIYHRPRDGGQKEIVVLMARETAPGAAHKDMFADDPESALFGGKAIAVPAEVQGYHEAWLRYGKVPWADLFHPTILLLTEGFPAGHQFARNISYIAKAIKDSQTLREIYVRSDGEIVKEGDIIKDLTLAKTLKRIAADPHTFYKGSLAKDIVADIADAGGIITEQDLRDYQVKFKEASKVKLRNGDYTLYSTPPPMGGLILQYIMKILDGYNFSSSDAMKSMRSLTYHRIVEAFKFAYAKRSALGDPDVWDIKDLIKNMTSEEHTAAIKARIDDERTFDASYYEPEFDGFSDSGTAHVNTIDQDGNTVAMTSSINIYFGSRVRGKRTGILFNAQMDDFSTAETNFYRIPPSSSNTISPGKMPMSSMSPAIFMTAQGSPALVIGAAGGPRIPTQIAMVAIGYLWLGYDLKMAIDFPHIHHQLLPNHVLYEKGNNDQNLLKELANKGHIIAESVSEIAMVHSIAYGCEKCLSDCSNVYCIEAVSDGRRESIADGF